MIECRTTGVPGMARYAPALALGAALAMAPAAADTVALSHGPIGVMGEHVHARGEFMVSYRFMRMDMAGNRDGSSGIDADRIATSIPNRFAGRPGQPPTLRVVPTEMTMDMHMFGFMYAPSDRVTLMGMMNVVDKEMDHITYQGGAGTALLGGFTTRSRGLGDSSLSALVRLASGPDHGTLLATLGVSFPTGDIDQTDRILTPANQQPEPRLPYPMQLGSGTWDLILGLTGLKPLGAGMLGAQWRGQWRLEDNNSGYRLGDEHQLTAWYGLPLRDGLSLSLRGSFTDRGRISGIDPEIVAPVQTADPSLQGGDWSEIGVGVNSVVFGRHRLAAEMQWPLHRDLNGPQLETDWQLTLGYQLAF